METQKTLNNQSNLEKEKWSWRNQTPFFFLKIALALQGVLCLHTTFKIFCSSSVKNAIGNLIGIALNVQIALGSVVILTVLILPIHAICLCLLLFLSSVSYSFRSTGLSSPQVGLFLGILFFLLIISFAMQLFSLMQSHLFIFAFVAYTFGVIFKKLLPRPVSSAFSLGVLPEVL